MVFAVLIFGQKIFTTLTKAFKKYLDQDTALDQTALLGVLDDIDKAGARWVSDSDNVKVMTKYVWVGARQRASVATSSEGRDTKAEKIFKLTNVSCAE